MRALKVSYSDVGEGWVAVNCEKTQFFLNTLYYYVEWKMSNKKGATNTEASEPVKEMKKSTYIS